MDASSTEASVTKSAELLLNRKRKRARKKANKKERQQRLDQMLQNLEAPRNEESSIEDMASLENSSTQLLPLGHLEIQTESATTLLEKSAGRKKRRKKRSVMKAMNQKGEPCSMVQTDVPSNPSLSDSKHGEVENGLLNPNISTHDSVSSERKVTEALDKGLDSRTGVQKKEANTVAQEKNHDSCAERAKKDNAKAANDAIEEVSLFEAGRISVESCSERTQLTDKSELIMHFHSAPIRPGDFRMIGGPRMRRKLLILDVNGLLADVVNPPPKDCNPDACFSRRAIFKRPYCDEFLKFCFERFDVGIWSSRSKKIIVKVVDYLLGNMKHKLLFCWDMSHSTQTTFKTLDNKHKPLVCKELSKVWDRYDPNLPWERGDYDESNTLLLDDSPYKALLNPAHTAIFPHSYNFKVENDDSLGPGGDLRIYLEGLLKAEHVQKYVEQHPFGQRAIDDTSSDWNFYSDVLCSLLGQSS
ncbi:PREDICTED: uncharacterized protein LOC109215191 [Nicotiana attenuata]|uniref:Mitochondrial import inner membrane translocase subunit TIM50 n=1 Tax=Nicotiana attenuata TaxID=49451 RepID=A0A1J6KNT5_NICAT|nr:PREDICTED: uncharacterized protein LOC109215191 [Nicotiana attenuata]XP_019234753.1 PREDICTED: uncharacterized protein LOC109215191 [Nicotiana attenuata]OIT26528.1 hypothetical protein A4A49_38196 [Nicotiana attenuata]